MSPPSFSLPLEPVKLEGRIVRLEPLSRDHLDGLAEVAFDPALWRWTLAGAVDRERLEAWLDAALANREAGTELAFATIDRTSGRPIGNRRTSNPVRVVISETTNCEPSGAIEDGNWGLSLLVRRSTEPAPSAVSL